jgi:hypothetical protein
MDGLELGPPGRIVMAISGNRCTTCSHEQRAVIDRLIASGTVSFRGIAQQFGLGRESVRRHAEGHVLRAVQAQVRRRREREDAETADVFEERLNETYALARDLAHRAANHPEKWTCAVGFLAQMNKAVEIQGKASGKFTEGAGSVTVTQNILVLPGAASDAPFALQGARLPVRELPAAEQDVIIDAEPDLKTWPAIQDP